MNMHIKYTVYVYPGRGHWHKPIAAFYLET